MRHAIVGDIGLHDWPDGPLEPLPQIAYYCDDCGTSIPPVDVDVDDPFCDECAAAHRAALTAP